MEEEMAEDLNAGELQEKLKRLESLQELRLCNEDKVTTIKRSAESEEVKKVLQKNPDISKERSNLLKGGGTHLTHTLHHLCTCHPAPLHSYHTPASHTHTHTHTQPPLLTHIPPPTPHTPTHTPPPTTYTHSQAGLMSHLR